MKKLILKLSLFSLVILSIISITACGASGPVSPAPTATAAGSQSPTTTVSAIPVTTEFGRMLNLVPYSFLIDHDVWFGNPGQAWELQGIQGQGLDSIKDLPSEKLNELMSSQIGINTLMRLWRTQEVASLTGFDAWTVDCTILAETPPSGSFSINEGNFDETLIKSKLVEQGYTRVEYGPYSYYSLRGDNTLDLGSDLSKLGVLAELNRIAVLDNTIVTASNTGDINGLLDVISGKESSIMDNASSQALAVSLGKVLSGVIMDPSRVLNQDPSQEIDPFYFNVPADWGLLHPYDMVGMGYKNDGKESSWVISLFYKDAKAASADADVLVNRMKSYIFATQIKDTQRGVAKRDFASYGFSIGNPVVQQYSKGATLTVECVGSPWPLSRIEARDLLFLVPDPSPYVEPVASSGQLSPGRSPEISITPDSTSQVFSQFTTYGIGAQPGYNDAEHQQINFNVSISNQSTEIVKNVKVTISTMATNEDPKPLIVEAKLETPGHVDFAPGQSETYKVSWNYDGSQQSKEEIARLVNQSLVKITFTAPDGRELSQQIVLISAP